CALRGRVAADEDLDLRVLAGLVVEGELLRLHAEEADGSRSDQDVRLVEAAVRRVGVDPVLQISAVDAGLDDEELDAAAAAGLDLDPELRLVGDLDAELVVRVDRERAVLP